MAKVINDVDIPRIIRIQRDVTNSRVSRRRAEIQGSKCRGAVEAGVKVPVQAAKVKHIRRINPVQDSPIGNSGGYTYKIDGSQISDHEIALICGQVHSIEADCHLVGIEPIDDVRDRVVRTVRHVRRQESASRYRRSRRAGE